MTPFKVKCINNEHAELFLIIGQEYDVLDTDMGSLDSTYYIPENEGSRLFPYSEEWFRADRFEVI